MIDHALFDPAMIDPETQRLNAEIVAAHAALTDPWAIPMTEVRARRRQGTQASPAMPRSARAEILTIDGPAGPLQLRVIRPDARKWTKLRGAYLHIHRGGWVWGSADEQDPWLERIADIWTFQLIIEDAWQGQGLGTRLMIHAAGRAKHEGAARLTFVTAGSNDKLLRAVGSAGFVARVERHDGNVHITVPLRDVRAVVAG